MIRRSILDASDDNTYEKVRELLSTFKNQVVFESLGPDGKTRLYMGGRLRWEGLKCA